MKYVLVIAFFRWMAFCGLLVFASTQPGDVSTAKNITDSICLIKVNGSPETYYGKATFLAYAHNITFNSREVTENQSAEGSTRRFTNFTASATGTLNYIFTSDTEKVERSTTFNLLQSYDSITVNVTTGGDLFVIQCSTSYTTFEMVYERKMNWLETIIAEWIKSHYKKKVWDHVCDEDHQYVLQKEFSPHTCSKQHS